jgi:hypothetical protein
VSPRSGVFFFGSSIRKSPQSPESSRPRTASPLIQQPTGSLFQSASKQEGRSFHQRSDRRGERGSQPELKHKLKLFDARSADKKERPRMAADERVGRHLVATSIEERIAEGAAVPSVPFEDRASCKAVTAKTRTRNWKEQYEDRCDQDSQDREVERQRVDHLRRTYRPKIEDFSHLYDHGDIPVLQVPEPWLKIWKRNMYCEQCMTRTTPGVTRVECLTCPVVQHVMCTDFCGSSASRTTSRRKSGSTTIRKHQHGADGGDANKVQRHHWRCSNCLDDMVDAIKCQRRAVRKKRLHRNAARLIVQLQCWSRMIGARLRHRRCIWAANFVQGHRRGKQVRREFRQKFAPSLHRPYRITVKDSTGLAIPREWAGKLVEVHVICTVLRSPEDMLCDVAANQVARIDVPHRLLDFKNCRVKFDETVVCNGSTSQAILVVTVVAAPKNPSDAFDPLATHNFEFLGQAELPLEDVVLYYKHRTATLQLGPYVHEVCDQDSMKTIRIAHHDRTAAGQITVDVSPCSLLNSGAGYINEIPSGDAVRESKKRWWAVLANHHLMLMSRPTEGKVKFNLPLKNSHIRLLKSDAGFSFEVRGSDFFHAFCCAKNDDVSKWYHKCMAARVPEHRHKWSKLSILQSLGVLGRTKGATNAEQGARRGSVKAAQPLRQRTRRAALSSSDIGLLG